MLRILLVALLGLTAAPLLHAAEVDDDIHNSLLWDLTQGEAYSEHYLQAVLGLGKHTSASTSINQASDGANGLSLGILRKGKRAWLGVGYQKQEVPGDVGSQSIKLDTGRVLGKWQLGLIPRYTFSRIYGQKGAMQSASVSAPGVAVYLSRGSAKWGLGAEAGVNLYSGRLDEYITDSRMVGDIGSQSQLLTTGLERSYWSVMVSRYLTWGEVGLDYLYSVSAVDLGVGERVRASVIYYLGRQWDLRGAVIRSNYTGTVNNSFLLGAKYYW